MKDERYKLVYEESWTEDDGIGHYEYWGSSGFDSRPYTAGYITIEWLSTEEELKEFIENEITDLEAYVQSGVDWDLSNIDIEIKDNKMLVHFNYTVEK